MDRKTVFLIATLMASPRLAAAQALGDLVRLAGPSAEITATVAPRGRPVSAPSSRACPPDWERKRIGDCWTSSSFGQGMARAYVHRAGWVVDARCFDDKRLTGNAMLAALDAAARKIDPAVSAEAGGCLGTYNPDWGRALKGEIWSNRMRVSCPSRFDPTASQCADAGTLEVYMDDAAGKSYPDQSRLISLRNVEGCMGPKTSGLSGVMLHETLHAADADSVPIADHNLSWQRGQLDFVRDRVYGTEALCSFGTDPVLRKMVNIIQCRSAVAYRSENPRYDLCKGFGTSFTTMPMGAIKH